MRSQYLYAKDFEGNHLQRLREKSPSLGVYFKRNTHFCETCQKSKPREVVKVCKGWKCSTCRGGE